MLLNQCISHTIDVVQHYVIIAPRCQEIFGFYVKVGERQGEFFLKRQDDVPHAVSVGLVVHRPVLGLDNPSFLFREKATGLDF